MKSVFFSIFLVTVSSGNQKDREEYLYKVNHCPQNLSTKEKRVYYSTLMNELMEKTIGLVDYLSSAES